MVVESQVGGWHPPCFTKCLDGITAEMLKYGGEIVVDSMVWIRNLVWEQRKVSEEWRKAIIVLLYKGKVNREEYNNYRGISLLSMPGKIYGRILNERIMKITDKSVGDEQGGFWKGRKCVEQIFAVSVGEQGGFWKGRGCVDQIFAVKILMEKYLEKDRKLFSAFMGLEKAYGRVKLTGRAYRILLRVYGVRWQLLEGIRSFYEKASASVWVNRELSEF